MRNKYNFYRSKAINFCRYSRIKRGFRGSIEYSIYSAVSFIGKLFIVLRPIFVIADSNIARMIAETHDFSIDKAFDGVKERYFSLLVAMLKVDLTAIIIVGLISSIGFWGYFVDSAHQTIMVKLIAGGSGIIFWTLAYLCGNTYVFNYGAIGYVSAKGKNLDTGDILLNSKRGLKGCKFALWFHTFFVYILRTPVLLGIINLLVYMSGIIVDNTKPLWGYTLLGCALLGIYVLYLIFVVGPLNLRFEQTKYFIYADHVSIKKTYVVKQVAGETEAVTSVFDEELTEKELNDLTK